MGKSGILPGLLLIVAVWLWFASDGNSGMAWVFGGLAGVLIAVRALNLDGRTPDK